MVCLALVLVIHRTRLTNRNLTEIQTLIWRFAVQCSTHFAIGVPFLLVNVISYVSITFIICIIITFSIIIIIIIITYLGFHMHKRNHKTVIVIIIIIIVVGVEYTFIYYIITPLSIYSVYRLITLLY